MIPSTPRFAFPVWDLADPYPEIALRDRGWTDHNVDIWRGSHPASQAGQGVLIRSYDPKSLIQARTESPPAESTRMGGWTGHGLMSITTLAISELIGFSEVKDSLHTQGRRPEPHDTVMLIDDLYVPAVTWNLHVGAVSVTVSASLLSHPVSVVTWRGLLSTPITLHHENDGGP